jgi:hypothetical protein
MKRKVRNSIAIGCAIKDMRSGEQCAVARLQAAAAIEK